MTDDWNPPEFEHYEHDPPDGEGGIPAEWGRAPVDEQPASTWPDTPTTEWAPAPEGEVAEPTMAAAPAPDVEAASPTMEWSEPAAASTGDEGEVPTDHSGAPGHDGEALRAEGEALDAEGDRLAAEGQAPAEGEAPAPGEVLAPDEAPAQSEAPGYGDGALATGDAPAAGEALGYDDGAPGAEGDRLAAELQAPAAEHQASAVGDDAPVVDGDAPDAASEASADHGEVSADHGVAPAATGGAPDAPGVDPTHFQSSPWSAAPAGEPGSAAEALPADASAARSEPEPAPVASSHARIELYLLRHADAGDPMTWGGPDEARPLSDKGRKQSKRLAKLLEAGGFEPDAVLSSPKLRALDTARIVAKPTKTKVRTDDRLAYGVGLGIVESILKDLPDARRVLLVGHDPDFSELVALLCNGQGVPMRKGSLVRIDVTRPLAPGSGELRWLVPPDLIRAEKRGADHGRR